MSPELDDSVRSFSSDLVIIDESFNQHIVRIDDHDRVEPVSLSAFKGNDFIKQFDAFVFSDYDKGFLDDSSISEFISFF